MPMTFPDIEHCRGAAAAVTGTWAKQLSESNALRTRDEMIATLLICTMMSLARVSEAGGLLMGVVNNKPPAPMFQKPRSCGCGFQLWQEPGLQVNTGTSTVVPGEFGS